jgi:hypothetical protein
MPRTLTEAFKFFWGTPSLSLGGPWSTSLDVRTRQCTWFGPPHTPGRGTPTNRGQWLARVCSPSITYHLPLRFPDTLAVMELDEREGVGYHRPGSRHVQARLKGGETWAHSTDVEIFISYRSTRQAEQ